MWWVINFEFDLPPIYISEKQEAMAGNFHVHNHLGVLKIVNMNGNIFQIYFTRKNFVREPVIVSNMYFRKKHLFQYFPKLKFLFSNESLDFWDKKIK